MKKTSYFILAVISLLFASCAKELTPINNSTSSDKEIILENEIPFFTTKTDFNNSYEMLKSGQLAIDKDAYVSRAEFLKTELIKTLSETGLKSAETSGLVPDVEDSIVADPVLLQMLNKGREVEIGNKVYKITRYGTFICNESTITKLRELLTEKSFEERVLSIIQSGTPSSSQLKIANIQQQPGVYPIDNGIDLFVDPSYPGSGNSSSSTTTNDNSPTATEGAIMNECDESNKTWAGEKLSGLAGYSVNCENNFNGHKRVKSVFWAQNFFFTNSVGVKVKMQKKRLGIWWQEQADELKLGWEKVSYNYAFKPPRTINLNYNNKHYTQPDDLYAVWMKEQYKEWRTEYWPGYSKPFVNLVWFTDLDESVNKMVYKTALSTVKTLAKKAIKSLNGPSTDNIKITFMRPNNKATVLVMPADGALHTYNHCNEEIKFDASSGALVFGVKSILQTLFHIKSDEPQFSITEAPLSFSMNSGSSMFGMAKYGGQWRGSRITKN